MNHSLREYSVLLTMESGRQVSTRVFAVGGVLAAVTAIKRSLKPSEEEFLRGVSIKELKLHG